MSNNHRFKIVEYEQASAETKAVYDETMQRLGIPFVLNWFKCQGNNPVLLRGNWEKLKATMLEGNVPFILKQIIIYSISKANKCKYCELAHGVVADNLSKMLTDEGDFRVTENMESEHIPVNYKIAARIVTKAGTKPKEITDEDFVALREAAFTDQEIQELMALADLTNMLNTLAEVSGIVIDNELMEAK